MELRSLQRCGVIVKTLFSNIWTAADLLGVVPVNRSNLMRFHQQLSRVVSTVSQETLAEMVGTTCSRANVLMNKFQKLGFIEH